MKPEPPFVRTEGVVHLDTKTGIHLNFPAIVHPGYPKYNYPLGRHQTFQDTGFAVDGVFIQDRKGGFHYFADGLVKFFFSRGLIFNPLDDVVHLDSLSESQ